MKLGNSDAEITQQFSSLRLDELIGLQREFGRQAAFQANPPHKELRTWAAIHDAAREVGMGTRFSRQARAVAGFVAVATSSVSALAKDPMPTYYTYTDVNVLDWYIGSTHDQLIRLKRTALVGIYYIFTSLVRFESESQARLIAYSQKDFEAEVIEKRVRTMPKVTAAIDQLAGALNIGPWPPAEAVRNFQDAGGYAGEASKLSGMINFSCFPQTMFHDEVLFLRVIHISEFCFFGIRHAIIEAIQHLRAGRYPLAAQSLDDAGGFANILHASFVLLRTMPPRQFKNFRDATGRAGAMQSRNYQLMEVYFRGMHPDKVQHNDTNPLLKHLRFLRKFSHQDFLYLGKALRGGDTGNADWDAVIKSAKALDRRLLSWRGAHLGFAQVYLADLPQEPGGASGAPYLAKYLRGGIFEETEPDCEFLESLFPELNPAMRGGVAVPVNRGIGI